MELNKKQTKILFIAHSVHILRFEDCYKIYTTPHHIQAVLTRLTSLGLLIPLENKQYKLTPLGKEFLGVEIDTKLEQFTEVKNEN